mmetsp:Transcript_14912/g.50273  ORF Transcript_14912/g.50273 Transcript_14912/m.50273 type:complete len:223 (-) Transcript_14912:106-774(-)
MLVAFSQVAAWLRVLARSLLVLVVFLLVLVLVFVLLLCFVLVLVLMLVLALLALLSCKCISVHGLSLQLIRFELARIVRVIVHWIFVLVSGNGQLCRRRRRLLRARRRCFLLCWQRFRFVVPATDAQCERPRGGPELERNAVLQRLVGARFDGRALELRAVPAAQVDEVRLALHIVHDGCMPATDAVVVQLHRPTREASGVAPRNKRPVAGYVHTVDDGPLL